MTRLVFLVSLICASLSAGDAASECVPGSSGTCKGLDNKPDSSTLLQSRTVLAKDDLEVGSDQDKGVMPMKLKSYPEDACETKTTEAACSVIGKGGVEVCKWGHPENDPPRQRIYNHGPRRRNTNYANKCLPKTCQYFESEATCPDRCTWDHVLAHHWEWWGLKQACKSYQLLLGGTQHKAGNAHESNGDNNANQLYRPEAFKSYKCKANGDCDDCTSTSNWDCIRGDGQRFMKVLVAAHSAYQYFEALIWTKCMGQTLRVLSYELQNGEVQIYSEGGTLITPAATCTSQGLSYTHPRCTDGAAGGWAWDILSAAEDSTRVHIIFKVTNPSAFAHWMSEVYITDPAPKVDECMTHQMCLDELDGNTAKAGRTHAGPIIRGSNTLQWQCLNKHESGQTLSGYEPDCGKWCTGCLMYCPVN